MQLQLLSFSGFILRLHFDMRHNSGDICTHTNTHSGNTRTHTTQAFVSPFWRAKNNFIRFSIATIRSLFSRQSFFRN